jgi:hypothetical protein
VESEDANEPTLPKHAKDPRLPMESTDPTLPIDKIELSDAIESNELRDHSERQDVLSEAMSASLGPRLGVRTWAGEANDLPTLV